MGRVYVLRIESTRWTFNCFSGFFEWNQVLRRSDLWLMVMTYDLCLDVVGVACTMLAGCDVVLVAPALGRF